MADMNKTERITIRISKREQSKIGECANLMGVSAGEFLRRCMQVMLMVMGDKQSEKAIRQILKEATGTMKMGAGLTTRTPEPMVPPVPPLKLRKGRKERESGTT
jgi:hypothetical protein